MAEEREVNPDVNTEVEDVENPDPDTGGEDEPGDLVEEEDSGEQEEEPVEEGDKEGKEDEGLPEPEIDPKHLRREGRIERLSKRAQEAEEALRIERLKNEEERVRNEAALRFRKEQEEAEKYKNLSPEERAAYEWNKWKEQTDRKQTELAHLIHDSTDQASFQASCMTSPVRQKYSARVNSEYQTLRQKGIVTTREAIFWLMLGKDTDDRATKSIGTARRKGADRIERSQSRPSSGGGDVSRQRASSKSGSVISRMEAEDGLI